MIQIFHNPKYDFMGLRLYGYLFSGAILLASLAGLWMHKSRTGDLLNYGIDFKGGTLMEVRFQEPPPVEKLRESLAQAGFSNAAIQAYGDKKDNTILIRVSEQLEETHDLVARIRTALRAPRRARGKPRGGSTSTPPASR